MVRATSHNLITYKIFNSYRKENTICSLAKAKSLMFFKEKTVIPRENEGKQRRGCVGKTVSKCYSRRHTFTVLWLGV